MRFKRLKDELNRPVITSDYFKLKSITNTDRPKKRHPKLRDFDVTKDWIINDMPETQTAKNHLDPIDDNKQTKISKESKNSEPLTIPESITEHIDMETITKKKATIDIIKEELTTQIPIVETSADFDR